MAKIHNTDNTKCWPGMWGKENSHSLLVGMQNGTATLEYSWQFLTKLNILLPYDPPIVLLDIYPKEVKTYVHTQNLHMDV